MKSGSLALVTSAIILGACAGSEKRAARTDSTTTAPVTAPTATPPTAPATGAITAAPVTGQTIEVQMIGDAKGFRFEPNTITLKAGDAIKFINVVGFPHNVGFDSTTVPADVRAQLAANMPGEHALGPLDGPMLMQPNEGYTISFAKIKAGTYAFHCTPHLLLGMKGSITVQ
jgi:plastocyanin